MDQNILVRKRSAPETALQAGGFLQDMSSNQSLTFFSCLASHSSREQETELSVSPLDSQSAVMLMSSAPRKSVGITNTEEPNLRLDLVSRSRNKRPPGETIFRRRRRGLSTRHFGARAAIDVDEVAPCYRLCSRRTFVAQLG
mgnify:CR=1 FL=1